MRGELYPELFSEEGPAEVCPGWCGRTAVPRGSQCGQVLTHLLQQRSCRDNAMWSLKRAQSTGVSRESSWEKDAQCEQKQALCCPDPDPSPPEEGVRLGVEVGRGWGWMGVKGCLLCTCTHTHTHTLPRPPVICTMEVTAPLCTRADSLDVFGTTRHVWQAPGCHSGVKAPAVGRGLVSGGSTPPCCEQL